MFLSKDHVRHALLLQLEAAYPMTLPVDTLWQGLRLAGCDLSVHSLLKEIEYLGEKGFVRVVTREICPCAKRYKLCSKGKDYLETAQWI
jgi:hypothetical protein